MKKVVLIFPDTLKMADFIIANNISNVIADSLEQSLTGEMTDDEIITACEEFDAFAKAISPFRHYQD
jgi:hypothetical protein